jgi:flagella basal body P-ring formation protein FlgA
MAPLFAALLLAALMASVHAAAPAAHAAEPATAVQDVGQLAALAQAEAALHLAPLTEKQRFSVGPMPPRLARCTDRVNPSVGPAPHMKDRVLVELRCAGATAWHLYVPVRIVGTASAAVAAHAIVAGTVLTTKDVGVEQRDLTALPPGYLDDPAIAVGLTASRAIAGGAVLTNQQLLGTRAVQRGQTVTLVADLGGMSVRMAGRAMTDGLVNQRVRVENLSSGKIVEGIARSEQVVEIIFQ